MTRGRRRAAGLTFPTVLAAVVLAMFGGACTDTRRGLGEDCLKSQDCLSGVCSELRCAGVPNIIDAQVDESLSPGAEPTLTPERDAASEDTAAEAVASGDGYATDAMGDVFAESSGEISDVGNVE